MNLRSVVILSGLIPIFFGLGVVQGFIPLSVLNTVTLSTPNVSCGSSGSCSVGFTITNNNATSNFAVYMKVTNAAYQNFWQNTIQVQSGVSSFTVSGISFGTVQPGAYIFSAFAISNYGVVISNTASSAFNVDGNLNLIIDPYNPATGTITVSPSCAISAATQSVCPYPIGTPVSVSFAPQSNYQFKQWNVIPGITGVPTLSTSNPLSLTMNQKYELTMDVIAPNVQYFTVRPLISVTGGRNSNPVPGTLSPSSATRLYQDPTFGATSAQFTATPSGNYTFSNWSVNGKNFTGNPLTLAYTDLQPLQTSGQSQFYLYAYFKTVQYQQLGVGAYAGITTIPAASNSAYTYPQGASVTVKIGSVASNICFTGWIVDGNNAGNAQSVTVTMNAYHSVFAQGLGKPPGGCGSVTPPPGPGSNILVGLASIGAGSTIMLLGFRMKRKPIG